MSKLFTKKPFTTMCSYIKLNEVSMSEVLDKDNCEELLEYNICNFRSDIILNHTKYITIYDVVNSGETKIFNKNDLGDKRITYPMLHFPVVKDNYTIIITSKSYDEYPIIHTINENIIDFQSSYYKGESTPTIKEFINNIRKCYKYFVKDNYEQSMLCDLVIISYDFNPNVIKYLEGLLGEFKKIVFDIKIRDIQKEGYVNDIIPLAKYNIKINKGCQERLIVDGYNLNHTLITKSFLL